MYDNNKQQQISRTEFNTPNFIGQMDNSFNRAIGLWLEKKYKDKEVELSTRRLDIDAGRLDLDNLITEVDHFRKYRNEIHTLGQANQELYDAQYVIAKEQHKEGHIKESKGVSVEDFLHQTAQERAWRLPHFQNNLAGMKALEEHINEKFPGKSIGSGGYLLDNWDEWWAAVTKDAKERGR